MSRARQSQIHDPTAMFNAIDEARANREWHKAEEARAKIDQTTTAFSVERWTGDSADVGSVMSFARSFSWGPIEDPELSAALAVWELEQLSPLHPEAKRGLFAALTTSARNHAGGAP